MRLLYFLPALMKRLRHNAILELVRTAKIGSQDELLRGLRAKHIDVSQSTLSRDIQELRLVKTGGLYAVMSGEQSRSSEASRRIIREFLLNIDLAQNLVVLKTGPGNASTVSQAIDDEGWPEAIGSLAGENTVFIAARTPRDARKLEKRLRGILE